MRRQPYAVCRQRPGPVEVRAAVDVLLAAGFAVTAPAHERLRLVSVAGFAECEVRPAATAAFPVTPELEEEA